MSELTYRVFRSMCGFLPPNDETILSEIENLDAYYLVAGENASETDFFSRRGHFMVLDSIRTLLVFLRVQDAKKYAIGRGLVASDGREMIKKASKSSLDQVIVHYMGSRIDTVRFAFAPPVHFDVPADLWMKSVSENVASAHETAEGGVSAENKSPAAKQESAPVSEDGRPFPDTFKGAEQIRRMLDCRDKRNIMDLKAYDYFEDFPALLRKFMEANGVTADMMDRRLNLPEGLTMQVITQPKFDKLSPKVLRNYLSLFGLERYILRYGSVSSEIRMMLANSPKLHEYDIENADANTSPKWTIKSFSEMDDPSGGVLYEIVFTSDETVEEIKCLVVTPLGYVDGRKYRLIKQSDKTSGSAADSAGASKNSTPSPMTDAERKRQGFVNMGNGWFKEFFKNNRRETSKEHLSRPADYVALISVSDELYDEALWMLMEPSERESAPEYQQWKSLGRPPVSVDGYTAEKLAKKYRIPLWDAYVYIGQILRNHDQGWKALKEDHPLSDGN